MKRIVFITAVCAMLAALLMAAAPAPKAAEPVFEKSSKYPYAKVQASIKQYKEYNPDIVGWLIVPGTNINEPVTYSDESMDYYLYRDWTGKEYPDITYQNWYNRPVCATYLDYRVNFPDTSWYDGSGSRNYVFYGHNWNNLRSDQLKIGNQPGLLMFAQLPSYTDAKFAQEHPYIYFSTEKHEGIWKVFAAEFMEVDPSGFPYNSPNPGRETYTKLLEEIVKRSIYDFNTDVAPTDHIITLSTCTREYNVGDQQRFAVFARLLRKGESESDPAKLTVNQDYVPPKFSIANANARPAAPVQTAPPAGAPTVVE